MKKATRIVIIINLIGCFVALGILAITGAVLLLISTTPEGETVFAVSALSCFISVLPLGVAIGLLFWGLKLVKTAQVAKDFLVCGILLIICGALTPGILMLCMKDSDVQEVATRSAPA